MDKLLIHDFAIDNNISNTKNKRHNNNNNNICSIDMIYVVL